MLKGKINIIIYIVGGIFVIWLAILIAPELNGGIINIIKGISERLKSPFTIEFSKDTIKCIFAFLIIYILSILAYISTRKNYRRGVEYGSAKWQSTKEINRKYKQLPENNNKILTQNVRIGLKAQKHRRNLNVLVVGGSGAGKTRFFGKPNIMQCNSSYVILDPKGELLRDTGYMLEKMGYKVKVLDLISPKCSHGYNPLDYAKDDNDVQKLVANLFKATIPKGTQSSDPFWDLAAQMLLSALIFYLKYEAPQEEQNFAMIGEMLRAGKPKESEEDYQSPLDILFYRLEKKNPNHIAVKYYKDYRAGAGKTLQSIIITLTARLEKFNLPEIVSLTNYDELEFDKMGEEKMALFLLISDTDSSKNFLASILYTQLFQELFYIADRKYRGALPIHVHFVMDEFANIALPDDFEKILSTMRSRNISVSIIIQNMSQLKALFEKQWESIVGNCDEFLYLGGNEQSTHKYVSELLGKETIDINTYGKTSSRQGSFSTNYQSLGRELFTPDEVRELANEKSILMIRGEKPVIDEKYDILKHPNIKLITDGGAKIYEHGLETGVKLSFEKIKENESIDDMKKIDIKKLSSLGNYELYTEEDIEKYFKDGGFKDE